MRAHPAFSTHLAAARFPNIGSYLGVAIVLSDGTFYGTLCAIDPEPRTLRPQQAELMVVLARLLATQIERDQEQTERKRAEEERTRQASRLR